jgi:hypothetical protein
VESAGIELLHRHRLTGDQQAQLGPFRTGDETPFWGVGGDGGASCS